MKPAKNLIVTADDFGLTARVNEAIALAYREGIVTTASLMVNGPAFESAIAIAHLEPGLDLGLHLNLTEGRPAASASTTLTDTTGFLYRHPLQLASALARNRVRSDDIEREIRAQIERALDSDVHISHIDGHKHVHVVPAVLRILRRIAPTYGIHAIRSTRERSPRLASLLSRNKRSIRQIVKQAVFGKILTTAWLFSRPKQAQLRLITPDRFYGIAQTGFLDTQVFADIVHDLNDGTHELMCHPGYVDDELRKTPTRLLAQRERELELLTDTGVRRMLEEAGVTLINYNDLVESYGKKSRPDSILHRYSAV